MEPPCLEPARCPCPAPAPPLNDSPGLKQGTIVCSCTPHHHTFTRPRGYSWDLQTPSSLSSQLLIHCLRSCSHTEESCPYIAHNHNQPQCSNLALVSPAGPCPPPPRPSHLGSSEPAPLSAAPRPRPAPARLMSIASGGDN